MAAHARSVPSVATTTPTPPQSRSSKAAAPAGRDEFVKILDEALQLYERGRESGSRGKKHLLTEEEAREALRAVSSVEINELVTRLEQDSECVRLASVQDDAAANDRGAQTGNDERLRKCEEARKTRRLNLENEYRRGR